MTDATPRVFQTSGSVWLKDFEFGGFAVAYETIPASALPEADAAWLVSSVRLAAPITAIDDAPIALDVELTASINTYLLSPRD